MASKKFYFIEINGKPVMKSLNEPYKFTTEQAAENAAIILYGRNTNCEIIYRSESKKIK